jgi:hypothetical protein
MHNSLKIIKTLLYSYSALHVLGTLARIFRSLLILHIQPSVTVCRWVGCILQLWSVTTVAKAVGGCQACAWQHPPTAHPTTFHVWKTRGCQCSFRLLKMGGVSPETCWASYKCAIIKLWYIVASCWIFLYELYYDAQIHEHQANRLFISSVQTTVSNY